MKNNVFFRLRIPELPKDGTYVNYGLKFAQDFLADGWMPQLVVFPILPLSYIDGMFGDDYGITRYIWGSPGDVIFSKTLKRELSKLMC